MNTNDLLDGENFKQLADIVIDQNSLRHRRTYQDGAVIYCKTDFLDTLFEETARSPGSYVLISHQSDYPITQGVFEQRSRSIRKWFAQNVDFKHPDLIPLPIGLENHAGPERGKYLDLAVWDSYQLTDQYTKTAHVYANFSLETHPSRAEWHDHVVRQKFSFTPSTSYRNYVEDLKRHYVCISPRGNGIDCHRTWECLYFNGLPVVPRHFMYDTFEAPIVQVDAKEQVNQAFVDDLIRDYELGKFRFDKSILTFAYWKNKILSVI